MTQQEKMFAMIEEWERSGQTQAAFARASGISIQTFHYWFRGYQQRQPTKSPPAFIELPTVALTQRASKPESSGEPWTYIARTTEIDGSSRTLIRSARHGSPLC